MPLKEKLAEKICETCGTKNSDEFSKCIYNICRKCKREKKGKVYTCKECGETEEDNFYEGRCSMCKKCMILSNNMNKKINELREKEYSEESKKEPLDFNKVIRNFLLRDYTIFGGLTITENNKNIFTSIENLEKINNEFDNKINQIKYLTEKLDIVNEYNKELIENNKIFYSEMQNMKNEIKSLKKELEEFKSK
jgi:hypothetical protein